MQNPWIQSFRLKTLPLALANTIIGSCLAAAYGSFSWVIFVLAALTTLLLQVLSNLANDYGDFVNGKDTAARIGPKRMVQSGEISPKAMLRAMIIVAVFAAISGVSLVLIGTKGIAVFYLLLFALLGIAAIVAAIKYTVGKKPFGYRGLGDVFVFIFFGLVGVIGVYFLHTQSFEPYVLLPASAIGLLSTAVLNLNNLRDYEQDKAADKRTVVVIMGKENAKIYHIVLVAGAAILALIYTIFNYSSPWQFLFLLSFPLFSINILKVFSYTDSAELYPQLKKLSMASLIFAVTFGIGLLIYTPIP